MNVRNTFFGLLVVAMILTTGSAFSQGLGVGLGAGNKTQVGVGGGAQGPNIGVAARTNTEARGKTPSTGESKRGSDNAKVRTEERPGLDIGTKIESNPRLAAQLQTMLPAGASLKTAAAGFKNQGQFIAALHASQNLDIPFSQLKAKMTGSNAVSLGSAIHETKPAISEHDAKEEAKKAEAEAKVTTTTKATVKSDTHSE